MITIIPAIDIIEGKCVRLTKGDYDTKKVYSEDPVEVARKFEAHGVKRLHMVDLDGAKARKIINADVVEKVASQTKLKIDFGGGVQSDNDIEKIFNCGASMVTAGSIAVRQPQKVAEWIDRFGAERIIIGADFIGDRIAVSGWQETSGHALTDFIASYYDKGQRRVICTDVSRDGMLGGPAEKKYKQLLIRFPLLKLIASGGVSSIADVEKLNALNLEGVIIGKALYEGKISMMELEPYLC